MPQKVSQRFIVVSLVLDNIALPESDHAKCIMFKMASKMAAKSLKFQLFAHQSFILLHCHLFLV